MVGLLIILARVSRRHGEHEACRLDVTGTTGMHKDLYTNVMRLIHSAVDAALCLHNASLTFMQRHAPAMAW